MAVPAVAVQAELVAEQERAQAGEPRVVAQEPEAQVAAAPRIRCAADRAPEVRSAHATRPPRHQLGSPSEAEVRVGATEAAARPRVGRPGS